MFFFYFHRFPKNEVLRQKWLEVIGTENTKPGLKAPGICSLHFAVSFFNFNRTLDVIRLRDDAVPSIHLVPSKTTQGLVLREIQNVEEQSSSMVPQPTLPVKHLEEQASSMNTQPSLPVKHLDKIYKEIEPKSLTSEEAIPLDPHRQLRPLTK
ncbi:unnamed protein product [Spodoptera littoralis]|uniref:THAP-type domain-containing protein n=1 Tax=Spodoptera littoralis TaxID=7109 RepID=A0A9P0IDX2_SPOLI|nr:unnamed protein product [Spodoptera littoralis]CAH1644968.1 unnamed protein product [Spodoptera littoralis]